MLGGRAEMEVFASGISLLYILLRQRFGIEMTDIARSRDSGCR